VLSNGSDSGSGLNASSAVVERDSASLSNGTCGTFSGSWTQVTLTGGADTTVVSGNCYRYRYKISDNIGNQSAASANSADAKIDTSAPGAPSLTVSESSGLEYGSGTTLYYNPQGSNSGSFTVDGSSTDAQSGIQKLNFPAIGGMTGGGDDTTSPYQGSYTWTSTTSASGSQTVTSTSNAGLAATATFTVTPDTAAPTGQTVALSGGPYYTSASVPLTLSNGSDAGSGVDASTGIVERDSAALSNGSCGAYSGSWTQVTLVGGADTSVASGSCYRYRYKISDNVGNQSAVSANSADAKVDTSAPTVSATTPTENSGTASQYFDSPTGTLYFRPAGTCSFTLNATATDAQSGVTQVAFPSLAGYTGFSGAASNDTTSPYGSVTYSWSAGATGNPGAQTLTATNGAGTTGTATVTITPDSTAPTGQSVALGGGTYYSTLSVPLTLANGTDGGSGIDSTSGVVERDSATLSGGTCGTFSGSWATVTLSGGADTTVVSGNCYRYRYKISDNVGNQSAASAASADAKVTTQIPTVAVAAPTEVTGAAGQYYDAPSKTQWFRPGASGSFTLNATASDSHSGVAQVAFPDVSATSGWTGSTGGTDTTSPYASPTNYAWSSGAAAPGTKTIVATNGAGATNSDTIAISADSTAPSGQTAALSGGPYYTTLSVPLTLANGTDAQSGIDSTSGIVERDSVALSNGTCGTFPGSWTTVTLSGGADTT